MMPFAAFAVAGCLAVTPGADHVIARDLTPAFGALAALAPETGLVFAPAPGAVRVLRAHELKALAARFHLSEAPAGEICVTRPVAQLEPARLLEAMKASQPQARIELLDYSRQPAPDGDLEFPATSLRESAGCAIWTGYVRYAGSRRFTIWARVKVTVTAARVLAIGDLPPGKPIGPGDVIAVEREEFPGRESYAAHVEDVVGRLPAVPIRAGTPIRTDRLVAPKEVVRGETVTVEVRNGGAALRLQAQAEASGAAGDIIPVRNLASNKRFRARVDGKGRVVVIAETAEQIKVNQ